LLKFFDEDPGSGMETVRIRDPGWKKVGSGIREKHPGSATLGLSRSKAFVLLLLFQKRSNIFVFETKFCLETKSFLLVLEN
jgi:hypothetical protein